MAGEKSGMKRFGFKRTTTSDHITTTTTELSDLGEGSSAAAVDAKLDATFSGHKKSDHKVFDTTHETGYPRAWLSASTPGRSTGWDVGVDIKDGFSDNNVDGKARDDR